MMSRAASEATQCQTLYHMARFQYISGEYKTFEKNRQKKSDKLDATFGAFLESVR